MRMDLSGSWGRLHIIGAVLTLLLLVLVGIAFFVETSSYAPFHIEQVNGTQCKVYDAECTCFGNLRIMESYPPQYQCNGYTTCQPVNRTDCPA